MRTSFPKSRIKLVAFEGIHPAGLELLRHDGFAVETLAGAPDEATLINMVSEAHLLAIRSKTEISPAVLAAAPKLLAVGCFCIGTNQVALGEARRAGVPVFNSPFGNTRSVAELTIAEVVALTRRLTEKSEQVHRGVWDKSAAGAHEVRGRTLGIVGYGHIGSQVSVLAEALGMRVLYHDILPKLPLGNARPVRTLADLLPHADVLTLHVPATSQTQNLIGASQLKKLKPGAMLINNARGSVVDIPALAAALKSGHLSGAALDVFPHEPAAKGEPFESALRGLANVILTPHIGGSTEEAQETIALDVAGKLVKFVNVGSTTGAVNVPQVELPEQEGGERASEGGGGEERTSERASEGKSSGGGGQRPHRILHFHRNVPGVLSNMHQAIASLGANISAEHLRTDEDVGYVVLDVDPTDGQKVLDAVRKIPETIRVRLLW